MFKYGPILKTNLLKCQEELEFFQNGRNYYSSRQIPVIPAGMGLLPVENQLDFA
jgi:hypothetical protein